MKFTPSFKKEPINFCGHELFLQQYSVKKRQALLDEGKKLEKDHPDDVHRALYLILKYSLVDEHGNPVEINYSDYEELPTIEVEKAVAQANKLNRFESDEKKV